MPLMKPRGYKFSILCDVFLLLSLQVDTFLTEIVLNLPIATSREPNSSIESQSIFYSDDGREKFPPEKFDAYKDFSDDAVHRILRDEEAAYSDEDKRGRRRWKKSMSSKNLFYKIQKRSASDVNNVDLFFDKNITESSEDSTKVIDLANKNLSEVAVYRFLLHNLTQSNLSEITLVNLTNNQLNEFDVRRIENLTNLSLLDLSWNALRRFVLNNSSLETLNLSWNQVLKFTSPPNSNLKELLLKGNNLSSVEHLNLSQLNGLQHLDLSCNQIREVEKNFFRHVKKLRRLDLSKNRLQGITKEPFYNLVNTDTLILSYNNISVIDVDTFLDLPNLQYLDLSHNNIQSRSVRALQGIPDLVGLSIAYNSDLGDSLQEFVSSWSLKELDASGTNLCRIPAALAQSVRALKLVDNWFSVIRCGDLDSYPLLQYLDLSFSHINEIEEDALGRLEILETLFLDHNNLRRVPISLPTSLEHLFLQNNQIMDIQPHTFQTLSNLKTLDLSGNKLIYLPGLPLPKLLTLNLQSSELRGLSQSVVKTSPKLKDLLLDGNPIKCSDLLGIAEWASPCQNERIVQQWDIKGHFQSMHNHFESFGNNQKSETDCISTDFMKLSRVKPECADSNVKFIHSNKLESQLQEVGSIMSSKGMANANLLHVLTSFLEQQTSGRIEIKNSTEEEQNFIHGKQEISSKHRDNQSETFSAVYDISGRNNPSTSENTAAAVANENEQDPRRDVNGPFYGNKDGHINEKSSFEAKTPILSSLRNSTENITKGSSGAGTSENITQEQQHQAILSKIKSDNNYVETSVLLGQESPVEDGINRGKLVVQVGSHDPANPTDSNFKSENIDSVPKVKENILSDEKHIRGESLRVNSLHKIDEGNIDNFEAINGSGIYSRVKNISKIAMPASKSVHPSVKSQQLAEHSTKRKNLSNPLSPSYRLAADEVIKNWGGQKIDETINLSQAETNLPKDNIESRVTSISTAGAMKTTSDVSQLTTTTGPLVTLSQRMMASKVNKADKVVFLDQPSVVDENDIIKRKQNVSQPLGQHYQQIQRTPSKASHRQGPEQLTMSEERKVQRRPKLQSTTTSVQDNRHNKESQQKPRNAALTQLNSEGILDKNQETRAEDIVIMKSLDRNCSKALVNGDKYSIKQPKKDIQVEDNLSHQNQIDKDMTYRDNIESIKIEQILGKRSNNVGNSFKFQDSQQPIQAHLIQAIKTRTNPLSDNNKKFVHTLNVAKDISNFQAEEDFSLTEPTEGILSEDIAKPESHHTVNTENLEHTADYITSRRFPLPTKGIRLQSEDFSNLHRPESHSKVNKELSLDSSRISNSEIIPSGVTGATIHHSTQSSNSTSGLPPEQWLDVRTTASHPGLFIVIGVTFGMLFALGLIHIYRCRRPWGYVHGPQIHNHNHHLNSNPDSREYCNCDDDYYIEMDQESQSSAQKDFLPMELLNSNSRRPGRQIQGW